MVRKWNVITQLEFGQYGRQILSIPEEGNIRTFNYTILEPQIHISDSSTKVPISF